MTTQRKITDELQLTELYHDQYVSRQLEKFRNRHNNHWKQHLELAGSLLKEFGPQPPARVLDLGCSIGTFALEAAQQGYRAVGLDFDPKSLQVARRLEKELGCEVEWVCANAAEMEFAEPFDAILCFDLLEHLSDEVLASCLRRSFAALKPGGYLHFHTFPTRYDHLFYRESWVCLPLLPFAWLPAPAFEAVSASYAKVVDLYWIARTGKTHKRYIEGTVHPNPLSSGKLERLLRDAGFEIARLDAALDEINPLKPGQGRLAKRFLSHQPIAQRSLSGSARRPVAG